MKLNIKYIKSILFLLLIFILCIISKKLFLSTSEGYSGFNWNDFENDTDTNKNNYIREQPPLSYIPNSNNICTFPYCNTFNGVENSWNKNNNTNNNNTNNNTNNSYRVVVGPYDFFKFNIISPYCCEYSNYSSGGGCLCLTPQQKNFLDYRGGNRS